MDRRGLRVLICCMMVVGWVVAGIPVAGADGVPVSSSDTSVVAERTGTYAAVQDETSPSGYDVKQITIELSDNGSAAWTVEYQFRLDDDNDTVDWEELQTDVEQRRGEYIETERARWAGMVQEGENATGREMTVSNFSVETDAQTTPHEYGYVRFTFEWDSFSLVEVNRIEAGDALVGFSLDERGQLIVSWPESYNTTAIEPEPDERRDTAAVWNGQTEFLDEEPRIELIDTGGQPVQTPDDRDRVVPLSWLAIAGIAVLAVVGVGWWVVRDRERERASSPQMATDGRSAPADGPPPELLSNEERVLRLLEENGGRIKQQEVVSELDWTEAKTSQVVSGLREEGEVDVFRIGRENVLTLPEETEQTEE
ncbi:helix-turn-helix transcriptional regulator [Natribaculum luteum]|uniref:Helix-turn-helix transcriptional regulator n=1 Tax=Natribaculum luteum TaxID=1586232 RepID=A0ABD5P3I3_9EURY|nr:hypothetical protein [Natribaculum luteum]